jgi:hypothetical protein
MRGLGSHCASSFAILGQLVAERWLRCRSERSQSRLTKYLKALRAALLVGTA